MSIRSLFEINHDFTHRLDDGFMDTLRRYLASGDRESAEHLERYGFRFVAQRHHSGAFRIKPDTEGFPDQ